MISVKRGRELALHIPATKYIEYSGGDHSFCTEDAASILSDIRQFITGNRENLLGGPVAAEPKMQFSRAKTSDGWLAAHGRCFRSK